MALPIRLALALCVLSSFGIFAQQAPLDLTPDKDGKLSQEQMHTLMRVVAQNYLDNFKKRRDYDFIERDVRTNKNGEGQVKSTEITTYEIIRIYGEPTRRLIEKSDKPLDAKEAAKEEEKIQKVIDKYKNESNEAREKRQAKEEKQRDEELKFVRQIADTHDFKFVETETLDGRETWVIDGEPRTGLQPEDADAKFVSRFRGRLWIDKADLQLARMDVEAIDTASVGWVLARIHKGTRLAYEQVRMGDDVWLPKHLTYQLDARVALFKGYNVDGDHTFRDYKKFRTSSKIVAIGEAQGDK